MPKQVANQGRNWYALHTYSGYEDTVARNLHQRIDSLNMSDRIFDVLVPTEKKIKIKAGKRTVVAERIYPGYVLVDMIVTDESWYVVRNTPRVTGFVGSGNTPVPINPAEIAGLQKRMAVDEPEYTIDVKAGDAVKIKSGPFKDFDGKVNEVDEKRGKVTVLVSMFGRETPVELDYLEMNKI